VTGIGFEYSRVFLPGLNNGLVGRFPSERLEVLGKIEGADEREGSVGLTGWARTRMLLHFETKQNHDMLNTKRMRFPIEVILVCIRWYAAYPLSYRHLEEMMQERGVQVDHSSISRWAIRWFCRSRPIDENGGMLPLHVQLTNSTLRSAIKRLHFALEIMLVYVRWYAAYPLSLRNLEEIMAERGVFVDHATVHRWALKLLPVLAKVFRGRKHPVGLSWRVDETYVCVGGQWKYLYRAVDRLGQTVDFLLTAHRDLAAARRFFEQAIELHGVPEKITIDKSGANTAAVRSLVADSGVQIELRQSKYLNNLVEQDHRAIKRRTRPMLGFKTFWSAAKLISGIETMHMIKKGQLRCPAGLVASAADGFYSLASR